jgi:NAD(P)-dependent dehydrogenase (short-subunit alcohol dehydrogenase family)
MAESVESRLTGKIALVTGGTAGIGMAITRRFVAEGARVFITGRRQEQLDDVAAALGPDVVPVRCDVSVLTDLVALYDLVGQRAGRIDVLVANAGGGEIAPLGTITEEHFDRTFATNVKGIVFGVEKAIPLLSQGASVILIGSSTTTRPDPGLEVYGASKAAVRHFARSWTRDTIEHGFRVNVLRPGPTTTPGLMGTVPPDQQADVLRQFAAAVPARRMGDPDETAEVALLLASEATSFVRGAEWFVDGGYAQI